MVADITTAVTGIFTALESLLNPMAGETNTVAWVALLALPVAGGVIALGKRLIKKAR